MHLRKITVAANETFGATGSGLVGMYDFFQYDTFRTAPLHRAIKGKFK